MGVGGQRHAPAALHPKMIWYPLHRRLSGPQDRSGRVRKNSFLPGFDSQTIHPVDSRYTDWAKPGRKFNNTASFFQLTSEQTASVEGKWYQIPVSTMFAPRLTWLVGQCHLQEWIMDEGYQPQGFSFNVRQKTMLKKKLMCILYEMYLTACLLTLVLLTSNNISFVVRNILIVLTCKIVHCFVRSSVKRLARCSLLHYVNTR